MLLLHGTGRDAAALIMTSMRDKRKLAEHDVVWKNCSYGDRIYFWGQPLGELGNDSVSVNQEIVVRAAESSMYAKAIWGSGDKDVCILVLQIDERGKQYIQPDPDGDGMIPSFYITIEDFNRCVQRGYVRLLAAVHDKLYQPKLRWEYLATMRATGRKPPAEGIADNEEFWAAMKKMLFGEGVEVYFERLFKKPLLTADWRSVV